MKHLLFITDSEGERAVELQAATSSIGRDPKNSIVLYSSEVSRQHAIFLRMTRPDEKEHSFRITDGNLQGKPSTNGLFINGKRCTSQILQHGDDIAFGSQTCARYVVSEKEPDLEWLMSGSDEAVEYMSTLAATPIPHAVRAGISDLDESTLSRLASFPELFIHPIVEISLEGKLTYCNPQAIKEFPSITTKKLDHPVLMGAIEAATQASRPQSVREVSIDDRIFEQSLSYIPQSDLIRSYLVEITSRKQAETELKTLHQKLETEYEKKTLQLNEANNRLKQEQTALISSIATNRALLNALPDPIFRIDHKGIFVNFKANKDHSLPFEPSRCLKRHLSEVFSQDAADDIQVCIVQALETETIQVVEFQMQAADSILYFEMRIALSAPNEVMAIVRDITERKRGEAEILGALDRERELNEMKTRFVSMTSHEFRTPLTTIMSSAELLERYSDRWDMAKKTQYLHKVQTAARHMTDLLNDVLLINKAEAGMVSFSPESLDLKQFCQEIVEELQITTDKHQLVMLCELSDVYASIDRKLMRHILTNLLSNAINYSPSGGEISLLLQSQENEIMLRVKDCGIGIPEESQATLFDSFVRGSNVGTISGTGLGLAIVKKSVSLHQGDISCQSTVGEGTTFTIELPLGLTAEGKAHCPEREMVSAG
ncbi:MAG: ATP-binding protein [Phormidesmis sp.]